MRKPQLIDLYCGLGGWAEGALAQGYEVVGFDIERHEYEVPVRVNGVEVGRPVAKYPAQLVLQDALTLHGSQFRDAACIVASPPCTEYSYMAMPWTRAKQIARALRGNGEFPEGYTGSRTIPQLNALFDACFRIQREANEANAKCRRCAGRGGYFEPVHHFQEDSSPFELCLECKGTGKSGRPYIPLIVENVKGAQPWVGPARWHHGSFYLWGDVPALMPFTGRRFKINGYSDPRRNGGKGAHLTSQHENDARKGGNGAWLNDLKRNGRGETGALSQSSSRRPARKAASAQIAKIPYALSSYIAEHYWPR